MGTVLLLIAVALLVYAIAIKPRQVVSTIDTRLSAGDLVHGPVHCQDIVELLQGADWIRDKKDVKLVNNDKSGDPQLVEIACKGVTYQIRITPDGRETSKLTVSAVFKSESWDIERVRRVQAANRIRCRIMERLDPGFTEQSQAYYGQIKTMYLLRCCAIAFTVAFFCYAAVPEILNHLLGKGSVTELHVLGMTAVVLLLVFFGVALSPYIVRTRSEKLLDGVRVPQYMDNDALMALLQNKLHLKTMKSLYFDENGRVAITGKCATYLVGISRENPRLSISTQEDDSAGAYQEADYIQCSIMKLFNSAHPENPEQMYNLLLSICRAGIVTGISALTFIVLLIAPFLFNYFGSKGIANSYLTQYSETVTVGDAFEAFFGDPKWENYKVGAQEYVDFTGKCTYMNENATMRITFAVFDDTFNVTNIAVNGIDMSALLWPGFLEAIYSGSENTLPSEDDTADFPQPEASFAAAPGPSQAQPPAPADRSEPFPPTLPPVDPNDPNAVLLSDHLGLYVDENGCCLRMEVASQNGLYFGAIYSSRSDAQNGINPLVEFSMGTMNYDSGTMVFTFEDGGGNSLYFERDITINDYYTLFSFGDAYFNGVEMSPYYMGTFYMVEQYIDVMT